MLRLAAGEDFNGRIVRGLRRREPPGVVEVPQSMPIGQAIDDILLLAAASRDGEYEGQVLYLPL